MAPRPTITQQFDRIQYRRTPTEAAALVAGCLPCELSALANADAEMATLAPAAAVTWEGPIGIEGEVTGDGRMIETNALRWDTLPIPLRYAPEDVGGHGGAVVVGRILTLERRGDEIWGTGDIDPGSEAGREYIRVLTPDENGHALVTGISMDLDDVSFEIRIARELLEDMPVSEEEAEAEKQEDLERPTDEEGRVTVLEIDADDEIMVTTDARIRAATGVAIPAFERARIRLTTTAAAEVVEEAEAIAAAATPSLVAGSRYPVAPPEAWFADPGLTEPTPITVTPDGRVYGHIAAWGTCHTGQPKGPSVCVTPPHSATGYAHFHTGAILTAEGTTLAAGRFTMDTLHAGATLSAAEAQRHYEDTGRVVAEIRAGEDAHGIWIAGALRPGVTDEQVRALRASPPSGDWRERGGNLEMIAALCVNVPGFPVLRPQGLVAGGVMQSLVASGRLTPENGYAPAHGGQLTDTEVRLLRRTAAREKLALERSVHAAALRNRVHQMTGR